MLLLAIVASIISQIDIYEGKARPVMYLCWMSLLFMAILRSGRAFYVSKFTKLFATCYVLFILFILIAGSFNSVYFQANYIRLLFISLIMTVIGDYYGALNEKQIQICLINYVASAVFYAEWVRKTYFPSYSRWFTNVMYIFGNKNSAALIWMIAVFILLFLIKYRNIYMRVLGYVVAAYLLVMAGISQCRTALLAMSVVVVVFAVFMSKRKVLSTSFVVVAFIIAWNINFIRRFIDQALFLTKYANADLNKFSSGRVDLIKAAIEVINKSPIVGSGLYYVDCSFISILAETGIIGFILIETVWIFKICQNFKYQGDKSKSLFWFRTTIFYLVESLLEGYPPFGPGVCSFMFWLLCAIYSSQEHYGKDIHEDKMGEIQHEIS